MRLASLPILISVSITSVLILNYWWPEWVVYLLLLVSILAPIYIKLQNFEKEVIREDGDDRVAKAHEYSISLSEQLGPRLQIEQHEDYLKQMADVEARHADYDGFLKWKKLKVKVDQKSDQEQNRGNPSLRPNEQSGVNKLMGPELFKQKNNRGKHSNPVKGDGENSIRPKSDGDKGNPPADYDEDENP